MGFSAVSTCSLKRFKSARRCRSAFLNNSFFPPLKVLYRLPEPAFVAVLRSFNEVALYPFFQKISCAAKTNLLSLCVLGLPLIIIFVMIDTKIIKKMKSGQIGD